MPNLVLRSTLYTRARDPDPVTIVVRASDLGSPIRQAADKLERDSTAWGFVVNDIFEVPDETYASIVRTTMEGMARASDSGRRELEHAMTISYFWNLDQLRLVNPRGALINPGRAPLNVDQLEVVMRQIIRRPEYRDQVLSFRADDDRVLTYRDGKFLILDPPRGHCGRQQLPEE